MYMTRHVLEQIEARGVITPAEVQQAVDAREKQITRSKAYEVWVVVRRYGAQVTTRDGYKGDVVVVTCDPGRKTVKTVLLVTRAQLRPTSAHDVIGG